MKDLERKFNTLLKDVETNDFYAKIDLSNRVNCYVCNSCGHITKTIDIDKGVTPFMFTCEKCGKHASSSFYKDIAPDLKPTYEWYRPTLKKFLKLHRASGIYTNHILNGGLLHRKIA